jgi:N-acetylmuramoyl-L-alanine amidase
MACVVALVAAVQLPGVAHAERLVVLHEGGTRSYALNLVQLEPGSAEWYVSANELARALDLERFWKPETRKMVFKVGDRRVQVTVDTRLVLSGGEDVLLHVPVRYQRGSVMLPLEFVEVALVPASEERWTYDADEGTLRVGRGEQDILGISYRTVQGDTEIRVSMRRGFRYRTEAGSSRIVRLRIFGARVDPISMAEEAPAPLIRTVRAEQLEGEATLYFELDRDVDGYEDDEEDGGKTIVILLRRPLDPVPRPEFKLPAASDPVAVGDNESGSCRVLILDAGHGGYDDGVRVPGVSEKNMTLEITKKMKPFLEDRLGMRVELLRRGDRALTADRRAELANKEQGDILISVHCNGWFDDTANGFEVLFVGPRDMLQSEEMMTATTPEAAAVFRPWDTAHLPYAGQSQVLAQMLQIEMGRALPIANRGAREANIEFLKGLAMPAVMLEIGFLTNPQEAAVLSDPSYPEALAAAIAAAVERFCEQFESDGHSAGVPGAVEPGDLRTGARR